MVNCRRSTPLLSIPVALLFAISLFAADEPVPKSKAFVEKRVSNPDGTDVFDASGKWLASFTDGCVTVRLRGASRTFNERTAKHSVVASEWVRVLPKAFAGTMDEAWLAAALSDTSPDTLQIAMQYIEGSPDVLDDKNQRIAGDAGYGPLKPDGAREEGADFNDYLGVAWTYADGKSDKPEKAQLGCVDCSGFMRLLWGHRAKVPLALEPLADRSAIPRRAVQIAESGPGVMIIKNSGEQVKDFAALKTGDLVFFDASTDDGAAIDHVGMYLGKDEAGRHRFISSRKSINGPTLGDFKGDSLLDGNGLYAKAFRCTRRL